MNYYERHLGDYARDAGHLSMLEHGAYTLLLDRLYTTERAIPKVDVYRICRARTKDEKAAVDAVLQEFFLLSDEGFSNRRATTEIVNAQARIDAARTNGSKGGRPPKAREEKTHRVLVGFDSGSKNETQSKAHQAPSSIYPDKEEKTGPSPALVLPDWLPAEVWQDWHKFRNGSKGWTAKARELSLASLSKLHAAGHSPRAVVDQSIERGWTGLFPVKGDFASPSRKSSPRLKEL
jgi:uncharacterized protein YdaU (DUF1376 family)